MFCGNYGNKNRFTTKETTVVQLNIMINVECSGVFDLKEK